MSRWPRDQYAQAVWRSDLKAMQKLVALAYADWAKNTDPPQAWLTHEQLSAVTGAARSTAATAVYRLVEAGWLVPLSHPKGRTAAVYQLTQPTGPRSVSEGQPSGSRSVQQSGSRSVAAAQPTDPSSQPTDQPTDSQGPTDREPVATSTCTSRETSEVDLELYRDSAHADSTSTSNFPHHDNCDGTGWTGPVPCLGCQPHLAPAAAS